MEKSTSTTNASSTIAKSVAAISAHLIYLVTARICSFGIKAAVVRALRPSQFAFTEIRLVLFVTLVLLPTISGARPVALRCTNDIQAAAILYFCIGITSLVTIILTSIMLIQDHDNTISLLIVCVSLLLRPMVELPVVFARRRQRYEQSSRARAIAVFLASILQTLAVCMVTKQKHAAPANASGHLIYTSLLGISMFIAAGPEKIPLISLNRIRKEIDKKDLIMMMIGTGEGMIKFLLENGEAIVLDIMCIDVVKSAYKLAGNLGSVLARFFNEALEEQAFNVFHRLSPAFRSDERYIKSKQGQEMRESCIWTLMMCLKAGLLVSSLFSMIGPAYSYSVLRLLYGEKWADETSTPDLLNVYFIYLVFMAINGVTEAFVSASGNTNELRKRTKFSMMLSGIYMLGLWFGAKHFGAEGIVMVNCMNMIVRSIYSMIHFKQLTEEKLSKFLKALPKVGVIFSLLIGKWIAHTSENYWIEEGKEYESLKDMMIAIGGHGMSGIVCVTIFVISVWIFEKEFVKGIIKLKENEKIKHQ